jgi:hypothetical protein
LSSADSSTSDAALDSSHEDASRQPDAVIQQSDRGIFLTGISNGGYMTILAATHFDGLITAFAPVAAGDPYGTRFDTSTRPKNERKCAPGVFRDRESSATIPTAGACSAFATPNELPWQSQNPAQKPSVCFITRATASWTYRVCARRSAS